MTVLCKPGKNSPGCPGSHGCSCTHHAECDSCICAATSGPMGECAAPCTGSCAATDVMCVATGGKPPTFHCMPRFITLCNPCQANADCEHPGGQDARCMRRGQGGFFCGSPCSTNGHCPSGYICTNGLDVYGTPSSQCLPAPDKECACSWLATTLHMTTQCGVSGKCAGTRACLGPVGGTGPGALGPCVLPGSAKEICDKVDNDCDGQTDEGSCNDGDLCTLDFCVDKACEHPAKPCFDDDPCTKEACVAGVCTITGLCEDGDGCTQNVCKDSKCVFPPVNCDDFDPCTTDACKADKCTHTDLNCDDADLCTDDSCQGGSCINYAKGCKDGDPCTLDLCKTGKCSNPAKCDDGDGCTIDLCKVGICSTKPDPCDDGKPCTFDSCWQGKCHNAPACDDGDLCTIDACINYACQHAPKPCNDGDLCTKDICAAGKCGHIPGCDDANACTNDACVNKVCQHNAKPVGTPCDAFGAKCLANGKCYCNLFDEVWSPENVSSVLNDVTLLTDGTVLAVGGSPDSSPPKGLAIKRSDSGTLVWFHLLGNKASRLQAVLPIAGGSAIMVGSTEAGGNPASWGWFVRMDSKGKVTTQTLHEAAPTGGRLFAIAPWKGGQYVAAGSFGLNFNARGWLLFLDDLGQVKAQQKVIHSVAASTPHPWGIGLHAIAWNGKLNTLVGGGRSPTVKTGEASSWLATLPSIGKLEHLLFDPGSCCNTKQVADHGIFGLVLSDAGDEVVTVGHKRINGTLVATLRVGKPGGGSTKGYEYKTLGNQLVYRRFRAVAAGTPKGAVVVVGAAGGSGHLVLIDTQTGKEIGLGGKVDAPIGSGGSLNAIRVMPDGSLLQAGETNFGNSTASWMRRTNALGSTKCK